MRKTGLAVQRGCPQVDALLNAVQTGTAGTDWSCCAESGLSPLALGLFFEPVGNIACDNDGSGNHHRGRGDDAGAHNEGDAGFVGAAMNGCHLNFLQDHVVGHPLALRVEHLRRFRHIHARLQYSDEGESEQPQDSMLQHGVSFGDVTLKLERSVCSTGSDWLVEYLDYSFSTGKLYLSLSVWGSPFHLQAWFEASARQGCGKR